MSFVPISLCALFGTFLALAAVSDGEDLSFRDSLSIEVATATHLPDSYYYSTKKVSHFVIS